MTWGRRVAGLMLWTGAVAGLLSVLVAASTLALGITPLVFRSGSMAPEIGAGALAFAKETPASDVRRGDVVSVVRGDGARVTHRVVDIAPARAEHALILKGDANATPDPETYVVDSTLRVVAHVPHLGRVVGVLDRTPVLPTLALVLGVVLVWRALRSPPPEGRHRGGRTYRRGPTTVAALVVVALVGAGSAVGTNTRVPTLAAFSDASAVTTGALRSGSVTKPAYARCDVDNPLLGTKRLTTSWTASSTPTPLTYTAVVRETGNSLLITASGTTRSATVTGNLLGSLLGSTFHIDVTASLPGTSWTRTSTQEGTFVLLGLGFACGSWT